MPDTKPNIHIHDYEKLWKDARDYYSELVKLDPDNKEAKFGLSVMTALERDDKYSDTSILKDFVTWLFEEEYIDPAFMSWEPVDLVYDFLAHKGIIIHRKATRK